MVDSGTLRRVTMAKMAARELGFDRTAKRLHYLRSRLNVYKNATNPTGKLISARWLSVYIERAEAELEKESIEKRESTASFYGKKAASVSRFRSIVAGTMTLVAGTCIYAWSSRVVPSLLMTAAMASVAFGLATLMKIRFENIVDQNINEIRKCLDVAKSSIEG